jgi:hypothetical protein
MLAKLVTAACIVGAALVTAVAAASPAAHVAGFPAIGAKPSTPTTGVPPLHARASAHSLLNRA